MDNGKQLDKIEAMLEPLIIELGADVVTEHLRILLGETNLESYFTVFATIRNIANRLERKAKNGIR
jgi:hypothetical protein